MGVMNVLTLARSIPGNHADSNAKNPMDGYLSVLN